MLPACCSSSAYITGSGFVCARQKWVVCARQTVGRLCTILLCVFVIVSLHHDSSSSFVLNISRAAFVCHLVELLSCSLTEVHPSSFTELISQLTQLISHNSTHLTTHTTRLISQVTQLISHKSSLNNSYYTATPHPTGN